MLKYIHGSEDSTDVDVMYIVDDIPDRADATRFCSDNSVENKNIAVVRDGVVVWVYKGTVDEVNNALYHTIPLHDNPEMIITRTVERDVLAKAIRVMRGTLTHCSRTQYRYVVKAATTSHSWKDRVDTIRQIELNAIDDFVKDDLINTYKFFAFQWGQLSGLVHGNELYSKSAVSASYPLLRPYLYREEHDISDLQAMMNGIISFFYNIRTEENGEMVHFIDYGCSYDLKKEVRYAV